eukprot:1152182-Pelagomonas_calceolata.AAC.4
MVAANRKSRRCGTMKLATLHMPKCARMPCDLAGCVAYKAVQPSRLCNLGSQTYANLNRTTSMPP